jgi:hypothetical protein
MPATNYRKPTPQLAQKRQLQFPQFVRPSPLFILYPQFRVMRVQALRRSAQPRSLVPITHLDQRRRAVAPRRILHDEGEQIFAFRH